jgi:Tol biopolymer transport system component
VDRQPRNGTAVIDGNRLTDVVDVPFLHAGGEISPDGNRVAFDTCAKTDRGINVARLDGSDVERVVSLSGDSCVDIRCSRDGTRLSYSSGIDLQMHVVRSEGVDLHDECSSCEIERGNVKIENQSSAPPRMRRCRP